MVIRRYLLLILASTTILAGCASSPVAEGNPNDPSKIGPGSGTPGDQSKGDGVASNATVVNDPGTAPSSGGYRVAPANPNDPKYKADPRLGGGG